MSDSLTASQFIQRLGRAIALALTLSFAAADLAHAWTDDASQGLDEPVPEFESAVSLAAGDGPFFAAAADLNGDSVSDLVTANVDGGDVSVLLGNGDGSFQAAVSFAAGDGPIFRRRGRP